MTIIVDVQPDEAGAQPTESRTPKARRAFSGLKREVTDEELSQSGTQKLLLDTLERAEEENNTLKSYRDKYYKADRELAVVQEKFKTNTAAEVLSTGTIAIGGAALAYAPELFKHEPAGTFCVVFGIVLIGVGIAAKRIRA